MPVGYLAGADPVLGAFFYPDPVIAVAAIGVTGAVIALIAEAGINPVVAGIAEGNGEAAFGVLAPFGVVHHHAGAAPAVTAIPAGVFIQAGVVVRNGKL